MGGIWLPFQGRPKTRSGLAGFDSAAVASLQSREVPVAPPPPLATSAGIRSTIVHRLSSFLSCLILAFFALPGAELRGQAGIIVETPTSGVPGQAVCITVTGIGVTKENLAISVEVNGVEIPPEQVTISGPTADGAYVVCFRIPSGASGGTITVTASSSGSQGTGSVPVQ